MFFSHLCTILSFFGIQLLSSGFDLCKLLPLCYLYCLSFFFYGNHFFVVNLIIYVFYFKSYSFPMVMEFINIMIFLLKSIYAYIILNL